MSGLGLLGSLSNLKELWLTSNRPTGNIPEEVGEPHKSDVSRMFDRPISPGVFERSCETCLG